jgi:hypothetical protein
VLLLRLSQRNLKLFEALGSGLGSHETHEFIAYEWGDGCLADMICYFSVVQTYLWVLISLIATDHGIYFYWRGNSFYQKPSFYSGHELVPQGFKSGMITVNYHYEIVLCKTYSHSLLQALCRVSVVSQNFVRSRCLSQTAGFEHNSCCRHLNVNVHFSSRRFLYFPPVQNQKAVWRRGKLLQYNN